MKDFALGIVNQDRSTTDIPVPSGIPHLSGGLATTGNSIIQLIIQVLFFVAVLLALTYLLWGGFEWILSGGDKQKLESARLRVIFSVVGLIVVFISFLILGILNNFFQMPLIGQ